MVDEFKSIRDSLFKALTGLASSVDDSTDAAFDEDLGDERASGRERSTMDARTARALLGTIFARAGKGKDEVVQIVAREIGAAVAAMLKEPLSLLAKHQKLQISFEFVPKEKSAHDSKAKSAKGSHKSESHRAARTKTSSRSRKVDIGD